MCLLNVDLLCIQKNLCYNQHKKINYLGFEIDSMKNIVTMTNEKSAKSDYSL